MAENSNVEVTIETEASYDAVFERVRLDAGQGNPAHVVQLDESATRRAIDLGMFVRISDPNVSTPEQIAELDDFLPAVRNFYTVNGEMWSVPWNSSNPVLIYNKKIFEAAGLDVNAPPRTFDEVLATCETIMASSAAATLDGCINWPLTSWFAENWVAMQGGLLVDQGNGREGRASEVFFNSPEMLVVINWWKEMADRGFYNYTGVRADYNGEGAAFITQKYAMHINSTAGVSNFEYYSGLLRYEIGVAPLPIPFEGADEGTVNGGASLWLSSGHPQEEQDAARDFIFFMTSAENIAKWHQNTGYFPNRQGAIDLLEAENFWAENPFYRVAVDQLLNTTPSLATSGAVVGPSEEMREAFDNAVRSIIDSGEAPESALTNAKDQVDLALYDYNRLYE
jgi:sn-glycerol 3-phosphate transport system substrate-binding protein